VVVLGAANVTAMTVALWFVLLPGSSSAASSERAVQSTASMARSAPTFVEPVPVLRMKPRTARPVRLTSPHRRSSGVRRPASSRRRVVRLRPVIPRPAPKLVRLSASSWSADLSAAIRRIPGFHSGDARWVVTSSYGSWGTADWYRSIVYVSPRVPRDRLYDVVVHEWSHLLSVRRYDGNVDEAVRAMNAYFGGSGLIGAERAADCMARLLGAQWTNYTPCTSASWRAGAARLVNGESL
jgi:hypothetical protein